MNWIKEHQPVIEAFFLEEIRNYPHEFEFSLGGIFAEIMQFKSKRKFLDILDESHILGDWEKFIAAEE